VGDYYTRISPSIYFGIVIPGTVDEQSSSFSSVPRFSNFCSAGHRVCRGAAAAAGFGPSTSKTEERAREKFDKLMQEELQGSHTHTHRGRNSL